MTLTFIDYHKHRLRHILLLCLFIAGLLPTDLGSHPISHCHDHGEITHGLLLKFDAVHHQQVQHADDENASRVIPPAAQFNDFSSKHHNSSQSCYFRGKNSLIAQRGITSSDHESLGLLIEQCYLPLNTGLSDSSYHHSLPPHFSTAKFIFSATDLPPPSA
ncbi:MAG: hypothetical protein ABFS09_06405 [Thermodesulfobacteriota bacterium]